MNRRRFYDIHCHAMNMSHPNLLAVIRRFNINGILLANAALGSILSVLGYWKKNAVLNLLSIMENDIGDFFLIVEYFLKQSKMFRRDGRMAIGSVLYDKIVLTPLMMDFGLKNLEIGTNYKIPPKKPITEQVVDVFNGIRKYCNYRLVDEGKGNLTYEEDKKENKLFEIYPFLGINTKNYGLEEIEERIIEKYFRGYTGRRRDYYETMGRFDGNIDALRDHAFIGIKLYPPLGFDPWPASGDGKEAMKVRRLYETCVKKNIPLTVHCSDGGFLAGREYREYSSPEKWARVLESREFSGIKVNLAHMGCQRKILKIFPRKEWLRRVLDLISMYENVYTDISCRAFDDAYYHGLGQLISRRSDVPRLRDRILFGSDFMINLLWIDSYKSYLEFFSKTAAFSDEEKEKFCRINPERFLFR